MLIYFTHFMIISSLLLACSEDKNTEEKSQYDSLEEKQDDSKQTMFSIHEAYPNKEELPECKDTQLTNIVFIADTKIFMYCLKDAWTELDLPDSDSLNSLNCKNDQVLKWSKSAWVCATDIDTTTANSDTLKTLICANKQIAKWDNDSWSCSRI